MASRWKKRFKSNVHKSIVSSFQPLTKVGRSSPANKTGGFELMPGDSAVRRCGFKRIRVFPFLKSGAQPALVARCVGSELESCGKSGSRVRVGWWLTLQLCIKWH
jgi:hypothetical protein